MIIKKIKKLIKIPQCFDTKITREIYMIRYLKSRNNKLKQDEVGNMYLINPGKPLLSAHMDTVQLPDDCESISRMASIKIKDGTIKLGVDIGADDKCGIAVAMQIYEDLGDEVSLLFTVGEERGLIGSSHFCNKHSDLLTQCPYAIVIDRRGNADIVGEQRGFCSKEFETALAKVAEPYGYKPSNGGVSDTGQYAKHINAVNLSAGYYDEHGKRTSIVLDELINAYLVTKEIVQNLTGEYPIYKYKSYNQSNKVQHSLGNRGGSGKKNKNQDSLSEGGYYGDDYEEDESRNANSLGSHGFDYFLNMVYFQKDGVHFFKGVTIVNRLNVKNKIVIPKGFWYACIYDSKHGKPVYDDKRECESSVEADATEVEFTETIRLLKYGRIVETIIIPKGLYLYYPTPNNEGNHS